MRSIPSGVSFKVAVLSLGGEGRAPKCTHALHVCSAVAQRAGLDSRNGGTSQRKRKRRAPWTVYPVSHTYAPGLVLLFLLLSFFPSRLLSLLLPCLVVVPLVGGCSCIFFLSLSLSFRSLASVHVCRASARFGSRLFCLLGLLIGVVGRERKAPPSSFRFSLSICVYVEGVSVMSVYS